MNVVIGDIQQDALDGDGRRAEAAGVPVLGLRTDVSKLRRHRGAGGRGRGAVREDPPGQQQRRRRGVPGRADLGGDRQGLGLDAVGQPDVGDLRHPDVRAADARARRARARGQHLLDDLGDRRDATCTGSASTRSSRMTEVLAADLQAAGANVGGDRALPGDHRDQPVPRVTEPAADAGQRGGMSSSGAVAARPHARRAVQGHAAVRGGRPARDGGAGEQAVPAHRPRVGQQGRRRHEAILAGAVGPASTGALDAEGVR